VRNWRYLFIIGLAAAALLVPGVPHASRAGADSPIILRYATMAPASSAFGKVLKAWDRTVKEETEGRVELRFYSGGSQGDERDFIRKIRAGQIDAAGITTTGLGMLVRPVLVLTVPELLTEYAQLHRVQVELTERFQELFREAGFELLAWGDGGKNRLFSTKAFAEPQDLKHLRPWAWKDDPVFSAYINAIGANPVRVGAMEVYGALQTRMIDTVPSSAMTAIAFQWYTKLNYMADDNLNIVIGGSIVKKDKFDQLTPEDQRILRESAERATRASDKIVHRDDARAYETLLKRGFKEVDIGAHRQAWDSVAAKTRQQLVGRIYSKSLLQAVEKAALD
jgi:TRAP-type C4-dicarboxylate transport system substrate-binding protein